METQWRTSMGGPTGLDYGVLLYPGGLMDLHQVPAAERRQMLEDVKVIECAALAQMNEKQQAT